MDRDHTPKFAFRLTGHPECGTITRRGELHLKMSGYFEGGPQGLFVSLAAFCCVHRLRFPHAPTSVASERDIYWI